MAPEKVITYGRGEQNERSFPDDPKMSRVHCQIIKFDDGTYQIIDFGSANGTGVNGRYIKPNEPVTLQPTDIVRIGERTLRWMDDFSATKGGALKPDANSLQPPALPADNKTNNVFALLTFIGGVVSASISLFILIYFFFDGGSFEVISFFPLYLKYEDPMMILTIVAILLGVGSIVVKMITRPNNSLAKIGMLLGIIGAALASVFCILGLLADEIVSF